MAAEANVLINIEGKPYMLSKHLKKSNLIEIITKLQEDLTKIKQFTKNQIDYKAELQKLRLENKELQKLLAKENGSDKENYDEKNGQVELFKEQVDIRNRLKKNYEKKARNTMQLYDEKIDLLKKQIVEVEKDRETYAEVIEDKQITISNLKRETEQLKKDQENAELRHRDTLRELRQSSVAEKQKLEQEKQKITKDMDVLRRTYIDLDKIRKYLEKNNASLKKSLSEANRLCEDRINKLTRDHEDREAKHQEEIKKMRRDVDIVINEAEKKIERIEEQLQKNLEEHETRQTEVLKEKELLKGQIKELEENAESLKNEFLLNRDLLEQTRKTYEESIRSLSARICSEREDFNKEMTKLKTDYDLKLQELTTARDQVEEENTQMLKKVAKLQSENKFMSGKVVELRQIAEENSLKYVENYNSLKTKVETIKTNYETEKFDLKTEISNRDKVIDDLTIENKKLEKQTKSLISSNELLKQENEKDLDKIWLKIQNQKDSYTEELQRLKENHSKKVKLIDNDLKQSKIDYEVLDKHYNELLKNKQNLEKTCENLRQTLAETEEEHYKQIREMKEEFSKDGKYLKQDFEKQSRDLVAQAKQIESLEDEVTKLKSLHEELQKQTEQSQVRFKEEEQRLVEEIEENAKFYKNDLENMKQFLAYKEEIINKLEKKISDQKTSHTLALNEKQSQIKDIEADKEMLVNEIEKNYEIQKQKYDILIFEFYKELKEQQCQIDKLVQLKSDLEQENNNLKKRNSDIITNITKQKEKFGNDSEFMKLLEYLIT